MVVWVVWRVGHRNLRDAHRQPGFYNSQLEAERAAAAYDRQLMSHQRHLRHVARLWAGARRKAWVGYVDLVGPFYAESVYQGTGGSVCGMIRDLGMPC